MWQYFRQIINSLKQSEKEFVVITAIIILLITLIPLTIGLLASDNLNFTGGTFVAAADKMIYLSQIEEIRQGHFLIHNLYTSEPQIGYFSPLWLVLGIFSKLTTISPLITFHLFRIFFGFIFLCLIYFFIAQIFSDIKWRKITFLAVALSSGLGIFTVIRPWTSENMYNYFGVDIWFSEGNTFLTLYHSPLFILSQILLLTIFWWAITRLDKASLGETISIAGLNLFLGLIHPYDLVIIWAVLLGWLIFKSIKYRQRPWPSLLKLIIILAASILAIVYFLVLKQLSPGFAGWAVQNITLSPPPYNYLVGYGLIFIFFLFGIFPALKGENKCFNFLGVWAIISWLLLYAPLPFQRRLGNGLHLPMVFLASLGLMAAIGQLKKYKIFQLLSREYFIVISLVIILGFLAISSNLFLLGAEFFYHLNGLFYIADQEKTVLLWLRDNLKENEVILSENTMGSLIPAFTARYVYIGHGHQTVNWEVKKYDVEEWFFKNNQYDRLKQNWLKREGVDYIYFGTKEKALGNFQPQAKDYLQSVYDNEKVEIYKVKVD